jgi:hypothetical protein
MPKKERVTLRFAFKPFPIDEEALRREVQAALARRKSLNTPSQGQESDEKDEKMVTKTCHHSSDTAEFNSSNIARASNSSLPSYASTSRERVFIPVGVSTPCDKVSESFIKELEQDWMDQIKQSNCSESSKSGDLEMIEFLAGAIAWVEGQIPKEEFVFLQVDDSHLGKIWYSLRSNATKAGSKFPYFLIKNDILYRKYMQDSGKEKHVICLPDALLPAVIHLLHVNHAHSTFVETRGIFRHNYYNRNDSRMMKSYIKACTLCAKKPA